MSRIPFWLPPTAVDATRSIPAFRVFGIPPGTPDAAALIESFAGSVREFYLKSAHGQQLSGLSQVRRTVDRGDHQLEYIHQHGQEQVTLHIHPSAQALHAGAEKVQPEELFTWGVVEIVLADIEGTTLEALAVAQVPRAAEIAGGSAIPLRSVAVGGHLAEPAAPGEDLLLAPAGTGAIDVQSRHNLYASFLVDLTQYKGTRAAVVDLYASVGPLSENIPPAVKYIAVNAGNDGPYVEGTDPHPVRNQADPWPPPTPDSMNEWDPLTYPAHTPFPTITFDTDLRRWTFGPATYEVVNYNLGVVAEFTEDEYTNSSNFFPWHVYGVATDTDAYRPAGVNSARVIVRGLCFKGGPILTEYQKKTPGNITTHRWETPDGPLPLPVVALRTVGTALGGGLSAHFGYTYLGRATFDLVHGGVSLSNP